MPAGRPTIYDDAMIDEICRRLAGGESLRSICADDHMPDKSTVLLWVVDGKHKDFSDQYFIARQAAGFSHADMVHDISMKAADGAINPKAATAAINGLKWSAERMASKHHSQRQEVDHTSSDGSASRPTLIQLAPLENADGDDQSTS